jgi:hypothetical protein
MDKITGGIRSKDSPSAREAGEIVNVRKGWIDILGVLMKISKPRGNYPMCLKEIHNYLKDEYPAIDQITSRPHEMVERGLIYELERQPRETRNGGIRNQKVYIIAARGLAYWKSGS